MDEINQVTATIKWEVPSEIVPEQNCNEHTKRNDWKNFINVFLNSNCKD